jgi:predicted DNA-binding transcriptional regulator AlpA
MTTTATEGAKSLDACRLLTVGELSDLLKLSPRSLWRMAALSEAGQGDGFPRPITVGPRLRRWRSVDVASYLARLAGEAVRR